MDRRVAKLLPPENTMARVTLFLVAALLCAAVIGTESSVIELGEFRIVQPKTQKLNAEVAFANFGRPEYGGDLQGHVAIPFEDARVLNLTCEDLACKYSCESMAERNYTVQSLMGLPAIMMVERGPKDHFCPFYDKAKFAQEAGAKALLVANYDDELFTMNLPDDDKSWTYNLTIPVALIKRSDADKLIKAYDEDPLLIGSMNWTNNIPQGAKVHWEYWISSDDACGVKCEKQKEFAKDFAPIAQILEHNGWTEFQPHYMMWTCPLKYRNTTLCDNLCIEGGEYCAPDPEEDEEKGYDGKDVVIENRRQICIYKQANASGEPWFWWDFVQKFDEECSMTKSTYDEECSERAFLDVGGSKLGGGLATLRSCMASNESIGYLEDEVKAQVTSDVVILPSIIIQGHQYRGALYAGSVLKALCAACYKDYDNQPSICTCSNEPDSQLLDCISKNGNDMCKKGKVGDVACSQMPNGITKCKEGIFPLFYTCGCEDGFELVTDKDGNQVCHDVNECKTKAQGIEDCTCDRCACHNSVGSFVCESNLPNACDKINGYCWSDTINGRFHTACVDRIEAYKAAAESGQNVTTDTFKMWNCTCPPGFKDDISAGKASGKACIRECKGSSVYDTVTKLCVQDASDAAKEGGIKTSTASLGLIGGVILAVMLVAGIGFGVYRYRIRTYMDKEIRSIMSQYMPLEDNNQA